MNKIVYRSIEGQQIVESFYKNILTDYKTFSLEQIFLQAKGLKTHVLKFGNPENPPLIMLHGSVSNSAAWLGCIAEFINDFAIFCIDIPGEPGLSEPKRLKLSIVEPVEWLNDVLDGLKIKSASFLSLSMGSWYALNFASHNSGRVKALSMLTAGGLVPIKKSFLFKALFFTMLGKRGEKHINRLVYHKTEVPPVVLEFQSLASKHFNPVMGLPIFSDDDIKRIDIPVQFFGGDHDSLIDSVKTGRRLKELIPKADVNILQDKGHVIIDQFSSIKKFLKDNCC